MNRYLEKIALNRFEQYLAAQPKDRIFKNQQVQKTYNSVQKSEQLGRIGHKMNSLGGAGDNYLKQSRDELRNSRGKFGVWDKETQPNRAFKKPEDVAAKNAKKPVIDKRIKAPKFDPLKRLAESEYRYKPIVRTPASKGMKALAALAAAGGAGLIGYGIKKNITE